MLDVLRRLTQPYGERGRETGLIVGLVDRAGVYRERRTDARLRELISELDRRGTGLRRADARAR